MDSDNDIAFEKFRELLTSSPPPEPKREDDGIPRPAIVLPDFDEGTPAPTPTAKRRPKLYDSSRRGYRRSSREEGIDAELAKMREEASGSPFYDVKTSAEPSTDTRGDLLNRLANLAGEQPKRQQPFATFRGKWSCK